MSKSLMSVTNKVKREKWIIENKDFINSLPIFPKFLLLVIYIRGNLTNVYRSLKVLNVTYCHLCKYVKLLEQMEFIEIQKKGRMNSITLTKKGNDFVEVFLGLMK